MRTSERVNCGNDLVSSGGVGSALDDGYFECEAEEANLKRLIWFICNTPTI